MTIDMYSEKTTNATALIRELTGGVEWFSAFDRNTEETLELFVAAIEHVRQAERLEQEAKACALAKAQCDINNAYLDERDAREARIAELERQLEEAEELITQTSHGAAERISDLERKVDAHRAEAHGLREAIFPRKIQDSKAWRVVPMSHLGSILTMIDPPPVEVDGQTMVFQNPHAAEVLRKISALVRAMLDEPLPEAATPSAPAVEQQPVAEVRNGCVHWLVGNWPDHTKLYTAPQAQAVEQDRGTK